MHYFACILKVAGGTSSLAYKGEEVCATDTRVGKVVLLAEHKDCCQCIIQLVFLLIMPWSEAQLRLPDGYVHC